jgi:hypothetical protein
MMLKRSTWLAGLCIRFFQIEVPGKAAADEKALSCPRGDESRHSGKEGGNLPQAD